MRLNRLYHSVAMLLLRTRSRRTAYIKKHDILGGIGEGCEWVPWLIPLYPKMIKLHNNVHVHKTARLIPHDVVNGFLKKARPEEEFGAYERLGCIEIMDNVYIAMNAVVLPDVRIGKDCIITAGSVVSSDIPDNSIVAGNPARVIGSFDAYVASRKMLKGQSAVFKNQALPQQIVDMQWEQFDKKRQERIRSKETEVSPEAEKVISNDRSMTPDDIKERILGKIETKFPTIDFRNERHLIEDEVLDSLETITIISLLEKEFNCKIPLNLVDEDHFDSVDDITKMIIELTKPE